MTSLTYLLNMNNFRHSILHPSDIRFLSSYYNRAKMLSALLGENESTVQAYLQDGESIRREILNEKCERSTRCEDFPSRGAGHLHVMERKTSECGWGREVCSILWVSLNEKMTGIGFQILSWSEDSCGSLQALTPICDGQADRGFPWRHE